MELEEIVLVLRSCFEESELRSQLAGENLGDNPYRRAAELILEGEEAGEKISSQLDAESVAQREKIRHLSLTDLRKSLVIEFLEPGRNLGLIVWALLRDGRVGASHLASQIYGTFEESAHVPPQLEEATAPTAAEKEPQEAEELELEGLDDLDELEEIIDLADETPEDESTVIEEEPDEGLAITDDDLGSLEELTGSGEEIEEIEGKEDLLDGLEDVLEGVDEEVPEIEVEPLDKKELDLEEEIDLTDVEELRGILDESFEIGEGEEEIFEPGAELPPAIEEKIEAGSEEPVVEEREEEEEPSAQQEYITMAGIDVPIESLHRACCGVFGEPVELVTDPELLSQDKIGVVGKRCGVKILHGPSWSIEAQPASESRADEPVRLSASGVEEALSKTYGEQIKLIPDPVLLDHGVIPFVGRQTGIVILRNEAARLGLPPWVDKDMAARIQAASDGTEVKISSRDIEDVQEKCHTLDETAKDHQKRLEAIEKEIESLEYVPVETEEKPEPVKIPEPEPVEEAEETPGETPPEEAPVETVEETVTEEVPTETEEESAEEEDLGIDLEALGEIGELDPDETEELEIGDLDLEEESTEAIEEGEEEEDLDFINEIEKVVSDSEEEEVKKVFSGETILILGGEEQYRDEYGHVVEQLGGACEWYQSLAEMSESEIAELVDRSDLILTLSDAITDPGILQATNYAQENNKRCFAHHSASPASVSKQLVKLVDEGKV